MIVMLMCVLAISAYAEDIIASKTESEEYGTVIKLNSDPGLDNAEQYVSTLKKINDSGKDKDALCILTDGTYYYVFPSSYIVWEISNGKFEIYAGTDSQPGLAQAMAEFNSAMKTDYYAGYSMTATWGNRRLENLVGFEFTSDVTWVDRDHCLMRYCYNLVEVRFNYELNVARARHMFRDCNKLKTVIGFEKVTNLESDTSHFQGCKSLEYIKLPTNITKIPEYMFTGCGKLVIDNLSELTQLTTIGAHSFQDGETLVFTLPDSVTTIEAEAFRSAVKKGGSFTINPTSKLTTIGNDAFNDCRTLESIYIPSSVTSIGKGAFLQTYALTTLENFENCQITELAADTFKSATKLKSIKLPSTLKTLGTAFANNELLTLVYLPDSIESMANTFTGTQPANAVYIFTGKDTSVLSACTRLVGANVILADEYSSENTYSGANLVVGYSKCIAYNGGTHGESIDDVVVTTYFEAIKIVSKCTVCGMYEQIGEIPALFVCLGYSKAEVGQDSIVLGFEVNKEAVSDYEKATQSTVNYGVFAVSQGKLGENDIFGKDGATDGVLSFDVTKYSFDFFMIKVSDFTETTNNVALALGAYVKVVTEDNTEYSYLQGNAPKVGEKYYFASFNEMANLTK